MCNAHNREVGLGAIAIPVKIVTALSVSWGHLLEMSEDLCELWSSKLPAAYTAPSDMKGPEPGRRGLPRRRPSSPIGSFHTPLRKGPRC